MKTAPTSEQGAAVGPAGHDFDEDAVCLRCGFDGAEWWHLERQKPKEERDREPTCDEVRSG